MESDAFLELLVLEIVARHGYTPLFVVCEEDAYGLLAEHAKHIELLLLDATANHRVDVAAFRQLQLDAPRVAQIPAVVVSDHPLTQDERMTLQPTATIMTCRRGGGLYEVVSHSMLEGVEL